MLISQIEDPQLVTAWKHHLESLLCRACWPEEDLAHAFFLCNFISSACDRDVRACRGSQLLVFPRPTFSLKHQEGDCSFSGFKVPEGEEHFLAPQPGGPLWPLRDGLRLLKRGKGHASFSGHSQRLSKRKLVAPIGPYALSIPEAPELQGPCKSSPS